MFAPRHNWYSLLNIVLDPVNFSTFQYSRLWIWEFTISFITFILSGHTLKIPLCTGLGVFNFLTGRVYIKIAMFMLRNGSKALFRISKFLDIIKT